MDIKSQLEAWGAWTRDNDTLGCKSPSLTLMSQAPHRDTSIIASKRSNIAHISDDDALVIDRAVLVLKQRSKHLRALLDYYVENGDIDMITIFVMYHVIIMRFCYGHRAGRIAEELNESLSKKLFNRISVDKIIERGMGIIDGFICK